MPAALWIGLTVRPRSRPRSVATPIACSWCGLTQRASPADKPRPRAEWHVFPDRGSRWQSRDEGSLRLPIPARVMTEFGGDPAPGGRLPAPSGLTPVVGPRRPAEDGRSRPAIAPHLSTLRRAAGTNPKIVSEVLGHKGVAITLDRYSHAMPTMQVEAMGRLDAMLGRSPLDAPDVGEDEAPAPNLWLDDEPGASPDRPRTRHKGSSAQNPGTERPDLSSDRAESDEFGTAYRNRGNRPAGSD